ncbi:PDZ domain-containing protein, partial [Streptomyces sp. SP18ES09]|uniref:PDZ domain-containing protein n=1 Tax=Streptomyces sp. SP18ES09 TaxID=3002532 RepID=UPI002E78B801
VIGVSLDMQVNGDGARGGEKGKVGSASVPDGGPAGQAGLRRGDVITQVDGQRVQSGAVLVVVGAVAVVVLVGAVVVVEVEGEVVDVGYCVGVFEWGEVVVDVVADGE